VGYEVRDIATDSSALYLLRWRVDVVAKGRWIHTVVSGIGFRSGGFKCEAQLNA
jgi:hypothetical protein